MIELMTIPGESSLINEALKSQLSGIFGKMEGQVAIKAIVDLSREKDSQMAAFLNTIAALSPKLELTLYGPEDEDRPMELDAVHLPVTGLYKDGAYGRVSFHGIPGGKEMNAFVLAVYNLAGPGQEVPKGVRKKIDRLKKRTNIKVCVSLACHHCAGVVAACQQIAILNPNIEAEMIDAALYEDLIVQYKIERVPVIIFNDKEIHMGGKTIEEILALLK